MTHQVHVRWIIALICAVTLVPNNPCALAQSGAAPEQAQGTTGQATPQASDKQPIPSEATKPPVATNNVPSFDAPEIKIDGRPMRGAKDARVTIVFFDDFQCPYSARMYRTLFDDIMKDYAGRVKVALRDTPNSEIHSWAKHAAIDANCLAVQNDDAYWEFADFVHAHQAEITRDVPGVLDKLALEQGQKHNLDPRLYECIQAQSDTAIIESRREAIHELGVRENPTLFINGEKLTGAIPASQLRERLDNALRNAGQLQLPSPTTKAMPATAAPASLEANTAVQPDW
jgi:protein-disulfide isomerase